MNNRFTRRGPDWRTWVVMLTVALIGATSAAFIWHGEHRADHDCVVCQLRHHTVADLTGVLPVGPVASAESVTIAPRFHWMTAARGCQTSPRAPPA